jgi:predicted CoA-binding protein
MSSSKVETVVVLGASNQPERYSYLAVQMLQEHGHTVIPVHPALSEILGLPVVAELGKITQPVDTLTLYLGPERLEKLIPVLVKLKPGRVIFNPGTESASVQSALDAASIPWLEACTLVLLRTGQF